MNEAKPVTRRSQVDSERLALNAIVDAIAERGYPPSQRELAVACGWSAASSANNLVRLLEAKGLLEVAPGVSRGLRITPLGHAHLTMVDATAVTV